MPTPPDPLVFVSYGNSRPHYDSGSILQVPVREAPTVVLMEIRRQIDIELAERARLKRIMREDAE